MADAVRPRHRVLTRRTLPLLLGGQGRLLVKKGCLMTTLEVRGRLVVALRNMRRLRVLRRRARLVVRGGRGQLVLGGRSIELLRRRGRLMMRDGGGGHQLVRWARGPSMTGDGGDLAARMAFGVRLEKLWRSRGTPFVLMDGRGWRLMVGLLGNGRLIKVHRGNWRRPQATVAALSTMRAAEKARCHWERRVIIALSGPARQRLLVVDMESNHRPRVGGRGRMERPVAVTMARCLPLGARGRSAKRCVFLGRGRETWGPSHDVGGGIFIASSRSSGLLSVNVTLL